MHGVCRHALTHDGVLTVLRVLDCISEEFPGVFEVMLVSLLFTNVQKKIGGGLVTYFERLR